MKKDELVKLETAPNGVTAYLALGVKGMQDGVYTDGANLDFYSEGLFFLGEPGTDTVEAIGLPMALAADGFSDALIDTVR